MRVFDLLFRYKWFFVVVAWFFLKGRFGTVEFETVTFLAVEFALLWYAGESFVMSEKLKSPKFVSPYHWDNHRGDFYEYGDSFILLDGIKGDNLTWKGNKAYIFPRSNVKRLGHHFFTNTKLEMTKTENIHPSFQQFFEEHKINPSTVYIGTNTIEEEIRDPLLLDEFVQKQNNDTFLTELYNTVRNKLDSQSKILQFSEEVSKMFSSPAVVKEIMKSAEKKLRDEEK